MFRGIEQRIDVYALTRQDLPPIEANRIASEVPLADHPRVVPALLQKPRDRHARAVETVEYRHAVDMRVLTGQDRRPARRADGISREHVCEQRAVAREPIDVRGLVDVRAVGANRMGGVIVRHDEHDVRTIGAAGDHRDTGEDEPGKYEPEHAAHASTRAQGGCHSRRSVLSGSMLMARRAGR